MVMVVSAMLDRKAHLLQRYRSPHPLRKCRRSSRSRRIITSSPFSIANQGPLEFALASVALIAGLVLAHSAWNPKDPQHGRIRQAPYHRTGLPSPTLHITHHPAPC
jgi:hypothetical protein